MKTALVVFLTWLLIGCAHAQNPQCQFTPGPTTSNQLCASTAFVQKAIGFHGLPTGWVNAGSTAFGMKCDNVTDDTNALKAAIATGASVLVPSGTCLITSQIAVTASGQRIIGAGKYLTVLKPSGNYDVFKFSGGGNGGGMEQMRIDAVGMVGGALIVLDNYQQSYFAHLNVANTWNGIFIYNTNTATFDDFWWGGVNGTSFTYSGDANCKSVDSSNANANIGFAFFMCGPGAIGSLVIQISNFIFTGNASTKPMGILIEGHVGTISLYNIQMAGITSGERNCLAVQNTVSGAADPTFIFSDNFQCEGSDGSGISLFVGGIFQFVNAYTVGTVHSHGVDIQSPVNNVFFSNLYSSLNHSSGVFNRGQDVSIVNGHIYNNSQVGVNSQPSVFLSSLASGFFAYGGLWGSGSQDQYGFFVGSGAANYSAFGMAMNGATAPYKDSNVAGAGLGYICPIGSPVACSFGFPIADRAIGYQGWSNAGSATLADNSSGVINTGIAIASFTLTMPPNPSDGQRVQISSNAAVTAFTLSPNAGQTIVNAATTLAAGKAIEYIYRASTTQWYALQ